MIGGEVSGREGKKGGVEGREEGGGGRCGRGKMREGEDAGGGR